MERSFSDRRDAGRRLGAALRRTHVPAGALVLGLPRGGVPVAAEVASVLDAPFDVLVVRKVGAPFQPELALGAVAAHGVEIRNADLLASLPDGDAAFERGARAERDEVAQRERRYRGGRPALDVRGRAVVIVDDGAATGATIRAAVRVAHALGATHVTAAVPVASIEALDRLRGDADATVCLLAPPDFEAVGAYYANFDPVEEREVQRLLAPT